MPLALVEGVISELITGLLALVEVSRYKAVTGAIGTRGGVISEFISGSLALVEVSRYKAVTGAIGTRGGVISELISGLISSCPHVQHEVE